VSEALAKLYPVNAKTFTKHLIGRSESFISLIKAY
jgi:hypothetical protein